MVVFSKEMVGWVWLGYGWLGLLWEYMVWFDKEIRGLVW